MTSSTRPGTGLGVALSCTPGYLRHAVAAVCSLRGHNATVPVTLHVEEEPAELTRAAARVGFSVRVLDPLAPLPAKARTRELSASEHIRSRLLKIQAIGAADHDHVLYLDSDTLVLDDVENLGPALDRAANGQDGTDGTDGADSTAGTDGAKPAECHLLLRRPLVPTLWDYGRMNFTDPELSRDQIAQLVTTVFGHPLTAADLSRLTCWNGGVLHGSGAATGRLADLWLDHYLRVITSPHRGAFVPNDQLALWVALLVHPDRIRLGELPLAWNFMPGLALRTPPGTRDLDEDRLAGVSVLHLATNKRDPWAERRISAALTGAGLPATWGG